MQILDDGRVTDSQGRTVSFKNTILIMTSNLGSQAILEGMSAGQREAVKDTVMSMVCAWLHIFVPSRRHPEPCEPCEPCYLAVKMKHGAADSPPYMSMGQPVFMSFTLMCTDCQAHE